MRKYEEDKSYSYKALNFLFYFYKDTKAESTALLQNSVGHTLRGRKLRGAQIKGSETLRGIFAFNLCPAEFWTPQFASC